MRIAYDYSGLAAVVTGGASGMGQATALRLAVAGARVAVVDIDGGLAQEVVDSLPEGHGLAIAADVSSELDVQRYLDEAVRAFGQVDLFFNNAGIRGRRAPLLEVTSEDFDAVFGTNVKGVLFGMRAVGAHMRVRGRGVIVNTASIAGLRAAGGETGLYAATKWAVIGMTRTAARELGPHGIRVNAVCPGVTLTSFGRDGRTDRELRAALEPIVGSIPAGRIGDPDDVAGAVMWLFSDAASYVNGVALPVDGGQMA